MLGLTGQDHVFEPYLLAGDGSEGWVPAGLCHLSCVVASPAGDVWAAREMAFHREQEFVERDGFFVRWAGGGNSLVLIRDTGWIGWGAADRLDPLPAADGMLHVPVRSEAGELTDEFGDLIMAACPALAAGEPVALGDLVSALGVADRYSVDGEVRVVTAREKGREGLSWQVVQVDHDVVLEPGFLAVARELPGWRAKGGR
ncbi:hypothetical protein ADK67_03395 [Saccharothrix sp. NRRL B-16348]|uniref:hypothetical protein n=1 Tax=Saccharothrix sp. NRRL B-16348 TaxID=1415542 RepID=UPI0006AFB38A|nr:hypothetical protein [Saccharothrix sp. NRRL B-16348]KOX34460.1 hypothetical protein ADK67_03395 [Saccharothrix sp. NRRL B-16348]